MPRMTPAERALIRRALPNFVNFMRFLHPGSACAAKFASSTAELGWDGSLLHCKRRGLVVPSFCSNWAKTLLFFETAGGRHAINQAIVLSLGSTSDAGANLTLRMCKMSPGCGRNARISPLANGRIPPAPSQRRTGAAWCCSGPLSRLPHAAGVYRDTLADPWCSQRPFRIRQSSALSH